MIATLWGNHSHCRVSFKPQPLNYSDPQMVKCVRPINTRETSNTGSRSIWKAKMPLRRHLLAEVSHRAVVRRGSSQGWITQTTIQRSSAIFSLSQKSKLLPRKHSKIKKLRVSQKLWTSMRKSSHNFLCNPKLRSLRGEMQRVLLHPQAAGLYWKLR